MFIRASSTADSTDPEVFVEVAIVTGYGKAPAGLTEEEMKSFRSVEGALRYARKLAEKASKPGDYPAEVSRYVAVRGPLDQRLSAIVSIPFALTTVQQKAGKQQLIERELHIGTTLTALTARKQDELAVKLTLNDTERGDEDAVVDDQTVPSLRSLVMHNAFVRLKNGATQIIGGMNNIRSQAAQRERTWKLVVVSARLVTDEKTARDLP